LRAQDAQARVRPLPETTHHAWHSEPAVSPPRLREVPGEQALPATTQADGSRAEDLWQLFVDSGYFNLAGRSAAGFEARRASFIELGRRAGALPEVLCEVVWPSERGVEATLSAMKPYRSTWLVHQLAKRQGGSRFERVPGQMLRELYVRTVEHALNDAGIARCCRRTSPRC
jgi:hypothetical protein